MSDESDSTKEAADFFMELVDKTGVAILNVKNGYMLGFKRAQLQEMLDKNPDAPKLVIFVQHPGHKN
jgi:predicted RNase H-like nuclease (RuvC/YqgF family)